MAKKSNYISLIQAMNNLGIYVWGGNGELLSTIKDVEAWIYKKETSTSNAKTAYALYLKRKGNANLRAMDCSGLIVFGLRESGAKAKNFDTTAEGLRTKLCSEITKKELCPGDLCFKMGWLDDKHTKWGAVHVGMYVGDNKVIESRGRAYGVVTRNILLGGWSKYGRLKIEWEEDKETFTLTRLLKKGVKGNDVKWVQTRLNYCGYNCGTVDGIYGSKTQAAVKSFQKNSGLKADGIVGKDTITKLGGRWWK